MRIFTTLSAILLATTLSAQFTQFDISSSFDYDGVATSNEISANVPGNGVFLRQSLGNHSINGNSRAFANQGSVASGTALPDDGILGGGKYQMSTQFDNGTDYLTKENNMIGLATTGANTVDSVTINLAPSEQGQYTSFNFLFVSQRDGAKENYRTWVEVIYSDGTVTVLDTGLSNAAGNDPRGTLGGNNLLAATDTTTYVNQAPGAINTAGVSNVLTMDRGLAQSGSNNTIRSGTFSIWEVDYDSTIGGTTDIPLDSGRTVLGFTFNIRAASSSNRDQELYIPAISATPVPEPATYALGFSGLALIATALIRRRKA